MKKNNNKGFMLAETLVVTTFVAGVLIYMFIQFSNLSQNYDDSYQYNTVEDLYSLRNIRDFIVEDEEALTLIEDSILNDGMIEITDCNNFTEINYCLELFELENIKTIIITNNNLDKELFSNFNIGFKKMVNKIKSGGSQKYRILAEFNNSTYATIRFGE